MWIPAPMVSHDQNHDAAPYFSCLELREAVVPLTTLFASYDTNTSASGVTGQKSDIAHDYSCLDLRNAVVPFLILLPSCDANKSAIVAPHFDYLD